MELYKNQIHVKKANVNIENLFQFFKNLSNVGQSNEKFFTLISILILLRGFSPKEPFSPL